MVPSLDDDREAASEVDADLVAKASESAKLDKIEEHSAASQDARDLTAGRVVEQCRDGRIRQVFETTAKSVVKVGRSYRRPRLYPEQRQQRPSNIIRSLDQRADEDRLSDAMQRSQNAVTAARDILRNAKRVSAEIIDERLAQISPLLNELYQRLRPHSEWRTIDYSIRGDVKRFLSLKVGDGLNPQFVFSSGQRRAAGLAFLLSVYLARNWARFSTLLLDDPVQHIDDFRALQLIEVLGALRLEGRQIVCAVEDAALADLLCRRLVRSMEQAGHRVDVDLGSDGGNILTVTDIPPLPPQMLRGQADLRLASG